MALASWDLQSGGRGVDRQGARYRDGIQKLVGEMRSPILHSNVLTLLNDHVSDVSDCSSGYSSRLEIF